MQTTSHSSYWKKVKRLYFANGLSPVSTLSQILEFELTNKLKHKQLLSDLKTPEVYKESKLDNSFFIKATVAIVTVVLILSGASFATIHQLNLYPQIEALVYSHGFQNNLFGLELN